MPGAHADSRERRQVPSEFHRRRELDLQLAIVASTRLLRCSPGLRRLPIHSATRVSKQETGVDLLGWPFRAPLLFLSEEETIYRIAEFFQRLRYFSSVDAGGETVDRIDDQHGNWWVENQIQNHARLHCGYTIPKQQR